MNHQPANRDAMYDTLKAIMSDESLSPFQRKLRARPPIRHHEKELEKLKVEREQLEKERQNLDRVRVGMEGLEKWSVLPSKLEKNDCSRLHRLALAFANGEVWFEEKDKKYKDSAELMFGRAHPFVVQHNWGAAFENATDVADGEIKLPYPICAFEFRLCGKTVIVLALQAESNETPLACLPFLESNKAWLCLEDNLDKGGHFTFLWQQIRAICIALDAEAATHNTVRAPHKLNMKRLQKGELPLYDYHVVSLNRKSRPLPLASHGEGRAKRLHFVRGHWRHFEEHKTWIKWHLRGNPDLGFIDKDYRL